MRETLLATSILAGCSGGLVAGDARSTDARIGDASQNDATAADAVTPRDLNSPGTDALLEQMMIDDPVHYQNAVDSGVQFFPTSDGESFYAYWVPPGFDASSSGFVVTLHGHGTFVSSDFTAWQSALEEHQYGYIGLQWWFGVEEETDDYYFPSESYPQFRTALSDRGIPGGKILFEGFSRGSTNTYVVTAIDNSGAAPLFLLTIANAGGEMDDYPPNAEINSGVFGEQPFSGTNWVLYCGELDRNPQRDGCPAMSNTRSWLEGYGAVIDLFIQDPTGGHGGFQQNPDNTNAALEVYDELRTR
jgi:hypothetical protein